MTSGTAAQVYPGPARWGCGHSDGGPGVAPFYGPGAATTGPSVLNGFHVKRWQGADRSGARIRAYRDAQPRGCPVGRTAAARRQPGVAGIAGGPAHRVPGCARAPCAETRLRTGRHTDCAARAPTDQPGDLGSKERGRPRLGAGGFVAGVEAAFNLETNGDRKRPRWSLWGLYPWRTRRR